MEPPTQPKPARDSQSLVQEQPGKLIIDPGIDRTRVAVVGIAAVLLMGGLAFAFTHFNRQGADRWLIPLAIGMGLAIIVPLVLVLRRKKWVFDLEARRMRHGKREVAFDDILGVVLTAAAKPAKQNAAIPLSQVIHLVVRSKESDLADRVARLNREMSAGHLSAEQLESVATRLASESERLTQSLSAVAVFQAAERLTSALGRTLFDLRAEPTAWSHKQLARPLRLRLSETGASPADPGQPPSQVTEEGGPAGPVLHFRRPKKQLLVTLFVNLGMLLVLLAIFFLVPSGGDGRDFNWGQVWPLVMAILLVVPALIKSLFSQNRLELGAERLRYVTRFLGEKSREVEVAKLRFLLVEKVGQVALVFLSEGPPLRLPMPLEAADWVKARIEGYLVSGA